MDLRMEICGRQRRIRKSGNLCHCNCFIFTMEFPLGSASTILQLLAFFVGHLHLHLPTRAANERAANSEFRKRRFCIFIRRLCLPLIPMACQFRQAIESSNHRPAAGRVYSLFEWHLNISLYIGPLCAKIEMKGIETGEREPAKKRAEKTCISLRSTNERKTR